MMNHVISSKFATILSLVFVQLLTLTLAQAQCPTVGNTTVTTCAFDGTSITQVADLNTLAAVGATSSTVVWYNAASGGTAFNAADPLTDGIYYLDTTTGECSPRIAVTVTVNGERPTCIDGDCDGDFFCESSNATVQEILNEFSGSNLVVSLTPGGTALNPTDLLTNTVYWITQTEAGCTSNPLPYNVIIQTVTPPTVVNPFPFFCQPPAPTVANLAGTVTGSIGFWYADASLSVVLPNSTPLVDGEDYFTYAQFGTCLSPAVSVTVTIGTTPEAGTPTSMQFCNDGDISDQASANYGITDLANVNLLNFLTGQDAGGIWTDDNSTGEVSSGTDTIINLNNIYSQYQAGTITQACFTYTVTNSYTLPNGSTDSCDDTATICITFDEVLTAGTATAPLEVCETLIAANSPVNLFDLLTGEDAGGTWADDTGSCVSLATPAAVDITCLTPGNYTYTYTVNQSSACPPDSETVTIIIIDAPEAGNNGNQNVCITATSPTTIDLFNLITGEDGGGTWADINTPTTGALTLPSTVNVTTLQGLGAATYTFEYTIDNGAGCIDTAQATITIEPIPDPVNITAPSACRSDLIAGTNPFVTLDGLVTAPNTPATVNWSVVAPTPAALLTDGATGQIDWAAVLANSPAGVNTTFTFQATSTAAVDCDPDLGLVTLTIIDIAPNSGVFVAQNPVCSTGGSIDLTTYLDGSQDAGGTWADDDSTGALTGTNVDPSGLTTNTYNFTYTATNACGNATTTIQVNIIQTPTADTLADVIVCDSYTLPALTTGNYFSGTGGTGTAYTAGSDITTTQTVYIYAETGTTPTNCFTETSFNVTVNNSPDITPITPGPVCDSFTFPAIAGTNITPGAAYYSAPNGGGTSYAAGSTFTTTTAGTYTFYIYDETGTTPNCFDQEQFDVVINLTPDAGTDNNITACISDAPITLLGQLNGTPQSTGNWYLSTDLATSLGDNTFSFNPATDFPNTNNGTSVSYTYIVSGTAPCVDQQATLTITLSNPGAPTATDQSFCSTDNPTIADLAVTGLGGYVWYDTQTSTTALNVTDALVDGEDYWVSQNNGCESLRAQVNVTINDPGTPVLTTDGELFCVTDNPTLAELTANIENPNNYTITWYNDATAGTLYANTTTLVHGETYYAQFTDGIPCASQIRLTVTVDLSNCDGIVIPDAFSPNNDGQNDIFTIANIDIIYPNHTIEIYNRYGNLVYRGNSSTPDFNGKSNQEQFMSEDVLPTGVYFYIVAFNKGDEKPVQGRLYLSR